MKLKATVTILASVMAMGSALAQKPGIIQSTHNTMNAVSNQQQAASNQALGVREKVPSAANVTHAQANQTKSNQPKPSQPKKNGTAVRAKTAISPRAQAHPTEANLRHRRHGHWVGGVWIVDDAQPGMTGGRQEEPVADAATGAQENAYAGSETGEQSVTPDSRSSANGRRDPFLSPVVSHASGSGCSTGKKCLEIGTISLRGVVHAESGFIAVVSNGLNKAYFLHENDPVFNGYVVKITGDSIVFQETLQDRLGKSFTREVVKKITAPAV
jgi:hypothetical protein